MSSSCSCLRLAQKRVRTFATLPPNFKSKTTHYDSLGITAKATQADVKKAYYELSKVYHPDKNEGSEEAAQKFRDITEAYEVLGNVKTRKLYDKGMSIGTSFGAHAYPRDRMSSFYEHREQQTKPSSSGGRQPIYDFDEWSKAHYGATFARDMARKERSRMMREREVEIKQSMQTENMMLGVGVFVVLCMYILSLGEDYDTVTVIGTDPVQVPPDSNDTDDQDQR